MNQIQGIAWLSKSRMNPEDLIYNDWVILDGLKNELLNGQIGRIRTKKSINGRYGIILRDDYSIKLSIKPENLVRVVRIKKYFSNFREKTIWENGKGILHIDENKCRYFLLFVQDICLN